MTQQYIRGELSVRLGELREGAFAGSEVPALHALRGRVESAPVDELPLLVAKAIDLVDAACWAALALGDLVVFDRGCREEASLYEFATSAGLLP